MLSRELNSRVGLCRWWASSRTTRARSHSRSGTGKRDRDRDRDIAPSYAVIAISRLIATARAWTSLCALCSRLSAVQGAQRHTRSAEAPACRLLCCVVLWWPQRQRREHDPEGSRGHPGRQAETVHSTHRSTRNRAPLLPNLSRRQNAVSVPLVICTLPVACQLRTANEAGSGDGHHCQHSLT